jgi:hypothetical protein
MNDTPTTYVVYVEIDGFGYDKYNGEDKDTALKVYAEFSARKRVKKIELYEKRIIRERGKD